MASLLFVDPHRSSPSIPLPASPGADGSPYFLQLAGEALELTAELTPRCLAALLQVDGRWLVLARPGQGVPRVNGVAVVALKVLDHRDLLELGELRLELAEEATELLAVGSPLVRAGRRCPVCHQAFLAGDLVVVCPHAHCRLPHHADCLRENGRCASRPPCGYVAPRASAEVG